MKILTVSMPAHYIHKCAHFINGEPDSLELFSSYSELFRWIAIQGILADAAMLNNAEINAKTSVQEKAAGLIRYSDKNGETHIVKLKQRAVG